MNTDQKTGSADLIRADPWTSVALPFRGFSLVELLFVIAVVALLLGLLVPALAGARESGRSGMCVSNLRQIQLANEVYANDHAERFAPGAPEALTNLTRWHGSRSNPSDAFGPDGGTLTEYISGAAGGGGGPGASAAVRTCPTFAPTAELLRTAGFGFERSAGGYGYNNAFVGSERAPAAGLWGLVTDRAGSPRGRFENPSATVGFADCALADGNGATGVIEYSFAEPRFWPDVPAPGFRPDPSVHFRHRRGRANAVWLDGHASTERRTKSWASGLYAGDPHALGTGWFGEADDNSLFDFR